MVNTGRLTEYDSVLEKDWTVVLNELKPEGRTMNDYNTKKRYGNENRSALMSILVCNPPLEVVKTLVELGGENTVTEVGNCGFNAIHYACWGNASLEVITYLLEIGGRDAVLQPSLRGGANPLHNACLRYKSNSLPDVIRLLIKVGGLDVITATDNNDETPLHSLLLCHELKVDGIVTILDEWYTLKNNRDTTETFNPDEDPAVIVKFNKSFKETIRQILKTPYDARNQILQTQFMKEYLTDRFIETLPLAILFMDLYIQIMTVCVFSLFINPNSPNTIDSTAIHAILIICLIWRLSREMLQVVTTSLGAYLSDSSNWFDLVQSVLIILTICTNLDNPLSTAFHQVLILATFFSWFELMLELHNFVYDLALFVVAMIKILKRLQNFFITTLISISAFAHVYYIAGPNEAEICNNSDEYTTKEEFNSVGGFTCTRLKAYEYSFFNLFAFEISSGVPPLIPFVYACFMLILLLNIIIAVICKEFDDVVNESELTFWSDRLVIVNELGIFSGILPSTFTEIPKSKNSILESSDEGDKRIDMDRFLDNTIWDNITEEDATFLHWWYGKNNETPSRVVRLNFFFRKSKFKDIFVPTNVFENVLLGYKRSHRATKFEKVMVFPFSIIVMAAFNAAYAIVLISGCVTFGLLWPESMKKRLFTVKSEEKKRIIPDEEKNSKKITETLKDISSKMKDDDNDLKEMIKKILEKNNDEIKKEIKDEIKRLVLRE